MNRPIKTLYVVLFSLLLLPVSLLALANLADYRMPAKPSVLDGGLAKSIERHYDEQFPLKQAGINLWAALEYLAFGEGRSGLVIGDGGWLYLDEEFDPVTDAQRQMRDSQGLLNPNALSAASLWNIAAAAAADPRSTRFSMLVGRPTATTAASNG